MGSTKALPGDNKICPAPGSSTGAPGAGAKGGAKAWHSGMGIVFFWMLVWITGAVLLPIGLSQRSRAHEYLPAADFFTTVSGGCTVHSVAHEAEQRQDKNPYCVDVYTYTFKMNGSAAVLTSEADEKQRSKGTHCDDSHQLMSTYAVGEAISCWQLASGVAKATVDSFYSCGNDVCVKLLAPADELKAALDSACLLITLGGVFLGVGLPMCGIFGCLVRRCKRNNV